LFSGNLALQQAWNRLLQARATLCIAASAFSPQITGTSSLSDVTQKGSQGGIGFGFNAGDGVEEEFFGQGRDFSNFTLAGQLSYEVDLWRRIDSTVRAACENVRATKQDLDATALTLSGTAAEFWLTLQEQKELIALIESQIAASRTQLELVELRYTVGESTGLDVYQQRLQLAGTEADLPPARRAYELAVNGLQTLLGRPAVGAPDWQIEELEETLPPLPSLGTPWDLTQCRPDLKAAFHRVLAADYEVGAAIADRLPKLTLTMLAELSSFNLRKFFDGELYSLAANLTAPIIDGGRRLCEVERRRAILWERVNAFGDLFLQAIKEVEDALEREKEQINLLEKLHVQSQAAQSAFEESQWRYIAGQTNYLDVITALQSLQNIERRLILEKKNLWSYRVALYRALGGGFEICGGI
ncbi:MAG: TolC family protein, partial [Chlamydiia bacterium]|nr:TolC family protein [Chlamydiia bacterium]